MSRSLINVNSDALFVDATQAAAPLATARRDMANLCQPAASLVTDW